MGKSLLLEERSEIGFEKEVKDWDFATNLTPEEIRKFFLKIFYENEFGTVSVVGAKKISMKLQLTEVKQITAIFVILKM